MSLKSVYQVLTVLSACIQVMYDSTVGKCVCSSLFCLSLITVLLLPCYSLAVDIDEYRAV